MESIKELYGERNFLEIMKDFNGSITFSGNPYIRKIIYEYCDKNNMKYKKHRRKVTQYICGEHKCHLTYDKHPTCCWRCSTSCPKRSYEGCYPHLETINRDKVITIYSGSKPNLYNYVYILH